MITEKDNVFYCDCGFSFQRGRSGAHDCADGLRNKLVESESRFAALAAENAGLKEACGGDGSYRDCPACAHSEYIEAPETPYTDAFLAEVRASGIDAWIESLGDKWNGTTKDAERFAAQLRKGVQS
jgi:hypothetical protein